MQRCDRAVSLYHPDIDSRNLDSCFLTFNECVDLSGGNNSVTDHMCFKIRSFEVIYFA